MSNRSSIYRASAKAMPERDPKHGHAIARIGTKAMDILDEFEQALMTARNSKEYTPQGLLQFAKTRAERTVADLAAVEREIETVEQRVKARREALVALPVGDPAQQREIRQELRKMDTLHRRFLIENTHDPEVIRACLTAPPDFPLTDPEYVAEGRARLGARNNPEIVAEITELEGFVSGARMYTTAAKIGIREVTKDLINPPLGAIDTIGVHG